MNSQTEILENRIAQIKVEIEPTELEKAKRKAARSLSRRVNIPGFRKGKAPYDLITRYLGEGAILEEAIDNLGPQVYREALEQSDLDPYGPGQLENVEGGESESIVLVFNVPLQPTVELGNYREIRRDYEPVEVTDEQVEDVLNMMLSSKATVEVKEGPAESGDQVKLDVIGELVLEEADAENEELQELGSSPLFSQKNWAFVLGEPMREPMPGFSEAVESIVVGEERSFDLVFPSDDDYEEVVRGRTVTFTVTCSEVSSRSVPELDDEFVKSLGEDGVETVEQLREHIREDLFNNMTENTKSEYADAVLEAIVADSKVEYPEMMVEETIDNMINSFQQQLARQGMDLEAFLRMRQIEEADMRADYRESARTRLVRSLVLGELVRAEGLELDTRAIDQAVKQRAARLSNGNPEIQKIFEQYLNNEQGRYDVSVELLTSQVFDRMVAIAKGEDPTSGPVPFVEEEVEPAADETAESVDEIEEAEAAATAEVEAPEAAEDEQPAE